MKITQEFIMPEEEQDFRDALNGPKYKAAIWNYDQLLRSEMKYKDLPNDTYTAYKFCREELRKILLDDNLFIEQ